LVNAERYITEEEIKAKRNTRCRRKNSKISELFEQLVSWIATYIKPVQMNANLVAQLDCLCSFTQLENKYVCPELDETFELEIIKRKASCYRKAITGGMPYIANDVFLDRNTAVDYDYRSQYVWKVSYFASNRADDSCHKWEVLSLQKRENGNCR
jgi:DNA mismatch repair protein MutS